MEYFHKTLIEQRGVTAAVTNRSEQLLIEAQQEYENALNDLKPITEKADEFVRKRKEGERSIRFHYDSLTRDAISTINSKMEAALAENREKHSIPDDVSDDLDNTTCSVQSKECNRKYLRV